MSRTYRHLGSRLFHFQGRRFFAEPGRHSAGQGRRGPVEAPAAKTGQHARDMCYSARAVIFKH